MVRDSRHSGESGRDEAGRQWRAIFVLAMEGLGTQGDEVCLRGVFVWFAVFVGVAVAEGRWR